MQRKKAYPNQQRPLRKKQVTVHQTCLWPKRNFAIESYF